MSLRVCHSLKRYRFLWTWKVVFSSVNNVRILQKCFNSSNGSILKHYQHKNSNPADLLQDESKHHGEDVLTKLTQNNEGRISRKRNVTPIHQLDPLKKPTKNAKIFETIAVNSPNEEGFKKAIEEFKKRDVNRLKLIDFVSTAMYYMEPFGVSKNVDIYNRLLDVFPKGVYHYRNVFDTLWTRYRPQIDCAIHLLTKLEENGIRPNVDTYDVIDSVFREDSMPMNKVKRIVFWFDKFDEMYPHPLPQNLPTNKLDLFELAAKRMFGDQACITEYKNSDDKEDSLVVGVHNKDLLHQLVDYDEDKPLFVEGPHYVWLRKIKVYYYILQADITPHLGNEDSILAVCIVDDGSENEVRMWINELQKAFPKLANLNVIFNISNSELE